MSPRYLRLPCGHRGRLRARPVGRGHTPWAGRLYEVEAPLRAAMRSLAFWITVTIAGAALLLAALMIGVALLLVYLR